MFFIGAKHGAAPGVVARTMPISSVTRFLSMRPLQVSVAIFHQHGRNRRLGERGSSHAEMHLAARPRMTGLGVGGRRKAALAREGPRVRSLLPPAESQSLARMRFRRVENPGFPQRVCAAGLVTGSAETRKGFDIAPTGGNISVGPYSSTSGSLMGSARRPRWSQQSQALCGLNRAVDL